MSALHPRLGSHHSHHRPRALLALVVAAVLALTACAGGGTTPDGDGGEAPPEQRSGGTLTVLTQDETIDLDPANSLHFPTTWLGLTGRRLTTWQLEPGKEPVVVPDLATDTGTVSEDGLTWTYTLKDGITFEDGTPITAQDIKYGVERTFAPELSGGLSYHKTVLEGAEEYAGPYEGEHLDSVEAPDDKTIVFHLDKPFGDWPWIVAMNAFVPVPESADRPATYGRKPVSSGPYKVESNKPGTELVLVRNEAWDPETDEVRTALPDEIVFKLSQSLSTSVQSLMADTGEAASSFHSEPLGAAELALVNGNAQAKERMITSDASTLTYLAINTERVTDPLVRQAIQYAVDRKALVLAAGGAQAASPATTLITPGIPGREEFDLYPGGETGDVEKAQELLAEAGAEDLTLELWTMNDPKSTAEGQALQQALERTGITVDLKPLDGSVWYADGTGDDPGYDLILTYWIPDYPSAASNIEPLYHSAWVGGGAFNLSRYDDPEVDAQIEAAISESDQETAQAMWAELDQQLMEAAVSVPLTYARNSFLAGSHVENMFLSPYPGFQNYQTLWLSE